MPDLIPGSHPIVADAMDAIGRLEADAGPAPEGVQVVGAAHVEGDRSGAAQRVRGDGGQVLQGVASAFLNQLAGANRWNFRTGQMSPRAAAVTMNALLIATIPAP